MKRLDIMPDTVIAVQRPMDDRNKVGILASELIRQAAQLTVDGHEKHEAVKQAIKAVLFGRVASASDMKDWLKKVNPIGGLAGKLVNAAIALVPVEKVVDALLDLVIRSVYSGMKRAGIAV